MRLLIDTQIFIWVVSCQRYSVISKEPSQLRNLRFLPAVEMTFLDWHDSSSWQWKSQRSGATDHNWRNRGFCFICVNLGNLYQGKIRETGRRPKWICRTINQSGFQELAITKHHAAKTYDLPSYHRDPFDHLLIAQAICEPLQLLTADKILARYSELVITV